MKKLLVVLMILFAASTVFGKVLVQCDDCKVSKIEIVPDVESLTEGVTIYQPCVKVTFELFTEDEKITEMVRTYPVGTSAETKQGLDYAVTQYNVGKEALDANIQAVISEYKN